jgi:hypothetical protein
MVYEGVHTSHRYSVQGADTEKPWQSLTEVSKSFAISVTVIDTVKKSNESQVHPKKPTRNMSHWWVVSSRRTEIGLRILFLEQVQL